MIKKSDMTEWIDYKALCERAIEDYESQGEGMKMLVYTRRIKDNMPVFKTVWASLACKNQVGSAGKTYWGIVGFDPVTEEDQWFNYNDCVSLEGWAVLDRRLKDNFGRKGSLDPNMADELRTRARAQLREGV